MTVDNIEHRQKIHCELCTDREKDQGYIVRKDFQHKDQSLNHEKEQRYHKVNPLPSHFLILGQECLVLRSVHVSDKLAQADYV